jgi:hypothetical protein
MVNRNVFVLINSKILYNTFMEYTLSTNLNCQIRPISLLDHPYAHVIRLCVPLSTQIPRKQIMYLNIDVIINLLMSTLLFIGIKAYIDDNNRNILYINPPFFVLANENHICVIF